MHLGAIAGEAPDRPAVIMGRTGEQVTFAELDERSNRLAHGLRKLGLERGGTLALVLDNRVEFLVAAWAAQRAGLVYTAVNRHLTTDEIAYIIDDCGAGVVIGTRALPAVVDLPVRCSGVRSWLLLDGEADGWDRYEGAFDHLPSTPLADECEGGFMLYSSGTTGRPKGIRHQLTYPPMGEGPMGATGFLQMLGMTAGDVYLCPAPLYHAAPLAWSMSAHRLGSTVVVMDHFDPVDALDLVARHRITHAQFVPTMFVRMLKLPESTREAADLSSLRSVVHAAAPCPVEVKRQMIEWWGPIINEYYSATEGMGVTFITAGDWLDHEGSVGQAIMGKVHITDDDGAELPAGEIGTVWFSGGSQFEYHNDPAKTAEAKTGDGWATVGDVGYVDADGYLYLTDRKAFTIISGGVNIYPQEAEDVLIVHPKVTDVAVFGIPHDEMGEEVKAVVQPARWSDAGDALEAELLDWCRSKLSAYKCPRSIDFDPALPRLDTGKLYKRAVVERYREG